MHFTVFVYNLDVQIPKGDNAPNKKSFVAFLENTATNYLLKVLAKYCLSKKTPVHCYLLMLRIST